MWLSSEYCIAWDPNDTRIYKNLVSLGWIKINILNSMSMVKSEKRKWGKEIWLSELLKELGNFLNRIFVTANKFPPSHFIIVLKLNFFYLSIYLTVIYSLDWVKYFLRFFTMLCGFFFSFLSSNFFFAL